MTISVAYNSSYTDDLGNQGLLPDVVFQVIGMMTEGQKVLIQETEKEEENDEEEEKENEDREKGGKI